ncbi:MAG TPA: NADH-quinone oxidoreductase subunit M, partial [Phycisphaerales bacterium]|nr:NADH-quinone oxidoreductase subunit M [Phycisphaerales bacterium]
MLLILLIVVPLICAGLIVFNPREQARYIATGGSLIAAVLGVIALAVFDWSSPGTSQMVVSADWVPQLGLRFAIGVDSVSLLLIALTVLLGPICIIGSYSAIQENQK